MNVVLISGNLVKDIELKYSGKGTPYLMNCLAVKKDRKNADGEYESDFINVTFFNTTAEYVAKYCKKGSKLTVSGILTNNSYINKDGKKVVTTGVIVNSVEVINSNKNNDSSSQQKSEMTSIYEGNDDKYSIVNLDDDADLPF